MLASLGSVGEEGKMVDSPCLVLVEEDRRYHRDPDNDRSNEKELAENRMGRLLGGCRRRVFHGLPFWVADTWGPHYGGGDVGRECVETAHTPGAQGGETHHHAHHPGHRH